jgi:hypothetical protein
LSEHETLELRGDDHVAREAVALGLFRRHVRVGIVSSCDTGDYVAIPVCSACARLLKGIEGMYNSVGPVRTGSNKPSDDHA